jgi:hypothetical protein
LVSSTDFPFNGQIPGGAGIEFLSVEIPVGDDLYSPFAWVHHTIDGETQEYALRLDTDKQVFLDHFYDDKEKEYVLLKSAPLIMEFLEPIYERLYKEDE